MDQPAAKAKVRQLLLSADNTIKNRTEPERFDRARKRILEAREVAFEAGLADLAPFIERRLAGLEATHGN